MDYEEIVIRLIIDGDMSRHGKLHVYEVAPSNEKLVQIDFFLDRNEITTVGNNLFDALVDLRTILETNGIQLVCNGAALNVYPSPMQLDMGSGRKAHIQRLGQPATKADIVEIFESNDQLLPASVEDQKAFHKRWMESVVRR